MFVTYRPLFLHLRTYTFISSHSYYTLEAFQPLQFAFYFPVAGHRPQIVDFSTSFQTFFLIIEIKLTGCSISSSGPPLQNEYRRNSGFYTSEAAYRPQTSYLSSLQREAHYASVLENCWQIYAWLWRESNLTTFQIHFLPSLVYLAPLQFM